MRKSIYWRLTFTLLLGMASLCSGETSSSETAYRPNLDQNTFYIGPNIRKFDYAEESTPPKKSTENGVLYGITLGIDTHLLGRGFPIRGILDAATTTTIYDGSTMAGTPLTATTNNFVGNIEINGGPTLLRFSNGGQLDAYVGIANHIWFRSNQASGGYPETYDWFYVPIGLRFDLALSRTWSIGFDGAVVINLGGSISADFSALKPGTYPYYSTLGSAIGYRMQLPVTYRFTRSAWSIRFTPWFEYSAIGKGDLAPLVGASGDVISILSEPASRTYQYGVLLAPALSF